MHPQAPIAPTNIATSRRTNQIFQSWLINGSEIPVQSKEAAAIEPKSTIGEPDIQNASLHYDLYTT